MKKKILYSLCLTSMILMASEYNIDAIVKAKGEQKTKIEQNDRIVKESQKSSKKVAKKYYEQFTLPRQLATRAYKEEQLRKRKQAGVTLHDCIKVQIECEESCKKSYNGSVESRCKSHCTSAEVFCSEGNLRFAKVELCNARCEILSDESGILSSSTRQKCFRECEIRYPMK